MEATAIKTKTSKGAKIARYTLVVDFKKDYQRANPDTGEVCERWTYRSDLENVKFERETGYAYEKEITVLGVLYHKINHKADQVKLFDNTKQPGQQLLFHEVKGVIKFPIEPARQLNFKNWIKSLI